MLKVAFIPIDNRPVCYLLPKQIADISCEIELLLPPREFLGGLNDSAQSSKILDWFSNLENIDVAIISLDTIAYGGLVASRRSSISYEETLENILQLKDIILKKNIKTYAISSIMRISNNNINEEEKKYWSLYGKKIFKYSYESHKNNLPININNINNWEIPKDILIDYLQTRKRNFDLNKLYLNFQKEKIFNYLVFSKDDCAEYGLNVMEAQELEQIINDNNLNAIIKTGADEIPLALFARAFSDYMQKKVKIYPKFLRPEYKYLISKYEDISIEKSVNAQIDLCGGIVENNEKVADIVLLINNFEREQGEWVMGVDTKPFDKKLILPLSNYAIADVAYANGADNAFVEKLLSMPFNLNKFFGYAAWNTSANTLGSVLATVVIKFLSKNINDDSFKNAILTRFLDDWAYQANVRVSLKNSPEKLDIKTVSDKMSLYEQQLKHSIYTDKQTINYSFPWQRTFELEITFEKNK